jgi:hypothetical protein
MQNFLYVRLLKFMLAIRILFVVAFSLITSSCAWIGRDYHFDLNTHAVDWHREFRAGRGSDKSGVHPGAVLLTHSTEKFNIKLDITYQDATVFGPIIVPIVPLPWQPTHKLFLKARVEPRDALRFDANDWRLTDLDTNREYKPEWINTSMPVTLGGKSPRDIGIRFPIEAAQIKNLKLEFGIFVSGSATTTLPALTLKKIKGDWHYNQFTL